MEKQKFTITKPQTELYEKLKLYLKQQNADNETVAQLDYKTFLKENVTPATTIEVPECFEYKLIPGLKKHGTLLYIPKQQQLFRLKYRKNNFAYYYCYEKNCGVGFVVEANDTKYCRLSSRNNVHNHGPQTGIIAQLNAKNQNGAKASAEDTLTAGNCENNKNDSVTKSPAKSSMHLQCVLWCDIERKLLNHPRQHFKNCSSCYEKMKRIEETPTNIENNSLI